MKRSTQVPTGDPTADRTARVARARTKQKDDDFARALDKAMGRERRRKAPAAKRGTNVGPGGHEITVSWAPAPGATRVEVDPASLRLAPAVRDEIDPPVSHVKQSNHIVVTLGRPAFIKSVTLHGLEDDRGDEVRSLPAASDRRLVLTWQRPDGSWDAPLVSAPPIPKDKLMPAMLTGATFSNRVYRLSPPIRAQKVRLSLVTGDHLDNFVAKKLSYDDLSVVLLRLPQDLVLSDPDGVALWSFPGEMPPSAAAVSVGFRHPMERALQAALDAGADPTAALTLVSTEECGVVIDPDPITGALVREVKDALSWELGGAPVGVVLPPPALDRPDEVTADVRVRYAGIRLLPEASDPEPASQVVSGTIVGDEPTARVLAPDVLSGRRVARVGVIGRAAGTCELSVSLARVEAGRPGAALGPPGVLRLDRTGRVSTHWLEMPEHGPIEGAVAVTVRASGGRFLWADGADGPGLRLAIHDPDPGGRPLRLGAQLVAAVSGATTLDKAVDLTEAFLVTAPEWISDLFLDVELTSLTFRYAR